MRKTLGHGQPKCFTDKEKKKKRKWFEIQTKTKPKKVKTDTVYFFVGQSESVWNLRDSSVVQSMTKDKKGY